MDTEESAGEREKAAETTSRNKRGKNRTRKTHTGEKKKKKENPARSTQ